MEADVVETGVPLRCACGALRGVLRGASPRRVSRIVCYCDDCQAFADFLEQGDATLDAAGGTEIFQTTPAPVAWTEGTDRLACLRLREGGLLRWYARCCRTPVANTVSGRIPFAGLIHRCVDLPSTVDRDAIFGPVQARLFARFARGPGAGPGAHDRVPVASMLRIAGRIVAARLRGEQRRSPFFDAEGRPIAEPRVLPAEALAALRARRA